MRYSKSTSNTEVESIALPRYMNDNEISVIAQTLDFVIKPVHWFPPTVQRHAGKMTWKHGTYLPNLMLENFGKAFSDKKTIVLMKSRINALNYGLALSSLIMLT